MLNVAAGLTRLGHESELATWFARDARGDKCARTQRLPVSP